MIMYDIVRAGPNFRNLDNVHVIPYNPFLYNKKNYNRTTLNKENKVIIQKQILE